MEEGRCLIVREMERERAGMCCNELYDQLCFFLGGKGRDFLILVHGARFFLYFFGGGDKSSYDTQQRNQARKKTTNINNNNNNSIQHSFMIIVTCRDQKNKLLDV